MVRSTFHHCHSYRTVAAAAAAAKKVTDVLFLKWLLLLCCLHNFHCCWQHNIFCTSELLLLNYNVLLLLVLQPQPLLNAHMLTCTFAPSGVDYPPACRAFDDDEWQRGSPGTRQDGVSWKWP
jgi:hypothetical protein